MVITLRCGKVRMPSGHTGKLKDGSKKTNSLIKLGQITFTKNHQTSKEKKPKNVEECLENYVGSVIAIS